MSDTTLQPDADYPLSVRRPELLKTPTGLALDDLTISSVVGGDVVPEDLRITPETLNLQAQIADGMGRPQAASNLRRAAELAVVPDERVLEMYNALRPNASTGEELDELAVELDGLGATECAAVVREASDVYARRDLLAPSE